MVSNPSSSLSTMGRTCIPESHPSQLCTQSSPSYELTKGFLGFSLREGGPVLSITPSPTSTTFDFPSPPFLAPPTNRPIPALHSSRTYPVSPSAPSLSPVSVSHPFKSPRPSPPATACVALSSTVQANSVPSCPSGRRRFPS